MATTQAAHGPQRIGKYLWPILVGLLILAGALLPWVLLSQLNARVRPDLPWAALVTLAYLALLLFWLNGAGAPRATSAMRRRRLRLWPPQPRDTTGAAGLPVSAIVGLLAALYLLWIVSGWMRPLPDLGAYPTTAYRWSLLLMGALTAGVVEEVAFRGYMLSGIEEFDRENALWITSLVFVASHITHGVGAVLFLGPGMFAAAMLYGMLARRTGTILPGIVIHAVGDLAYVSFGVLRGNLSLLFVE